MNWNRTLFWLFGVSPVILILAISIIDYQLIFGGQPLDRLSFLTYIGTLFGYYSLLFSVYAVLQIREITNSYFFKTRSPDLSRKLRKISSEMSAFGNEALNMLNSQQFMSEIPVALRSAKRVRNSHVNKVAKEAESTFKALKRALGSAQVSGEAAGSVPKFWELYQKVTELADEMKTQIEEAKAKP